MSLPVYLLDEDVAPPPPPVYKTQHFAFRNTDAEPWTGGVYPSDAGQATNLVLPAKTYPTAADDILAFGHEGTSAASNANSANAGANSLLGGFGLITTNGRTFRIDRDPGTYAMRLALGHGSVGATRAMWACFDGSVGQLFTDIGAVQLAKWEPTTVFAPNAYLIAPDLGIWKVTTGGGGTSGTVAPSGAGPTFTDGGLGLTRMARDVLGLWDGSPATNVVIDQNGALTAASAWAATAPLSILVSNRGANSCLTFIRIATGPAYPRCVSLQRTA